MRVLAIVAEAATAPACLDAAVAAASRIGGHVSIEALHVVVDPERLVTAASEEIAIQQLRVQDEGTARHRAEATRAVFAAWSARLPGPAPSIAWKELIGAEEEHVAREAAQFDLLVMARPHNKDGRDALHAALGAAARPLLLVPSDWRRPERFAARIAIAWNDTAPACHAVDGAMPWIRAAERDTIILIEEPAAMAAALVERLADEGVAAELRIVKRSGRSLGDQIVDEAHAAGADLLVMGAYRHAPFIEWLIGGTTRHALRHADLPVLLAH